MQNSLVTALPMRRPRGFTLVELLVVLAIISLLISLLMPALSNARRKTRDIACLATLRQLGQAAFMYATDNKQSCLPQVRDATTGTTFNAYGLTTDAMGDQRWAYWSEALFPYVSKNQKAYACSFEAKRYGQTPVAWGYANNPFMYPVDATGARTLPIPLKIDQFRKASQKFYLMDAGFSNFSDAPSIAPNHHWTPYLSYEYAYSSGNRSVPAIRHNLVQMPNLIKDQRPQGNMGFNAFYFDGHAAFVQWDPVVPQYAYGGASTPADRLKRDTYWLP